MNPHYNFILHFSEFRKPEESWAYIHRESMNDYWNGTAPANGYLAILGASPEECIAIAVLRKYHNPT